MKFSVIIPSYNSSRTIVRLLDSFKQEKNDFYEVIIVDDCSTDDTLEVINKYSQSVDTPIRVIEKEKNSGPGVSRNIGIKEAQGDYLCFMDSDDYVDNTYFAAINRALESGADIVYFNCSMVIGEQIIPGQTKHFSVKEDFIALVSGSLCMFCSKRTLWDGIEMPPIKNAEDIAVIPIVMSRASKIISIPDNLYYYMHNAGSLSNSYNPQICDNFVRSFQYTLKHIDKERYHDQVEFHGIKTILYGVTLNALKADVSIQKIKQIWADFYQNFPDWYRNKYIKNLPLKKRFYLSMVHYKLTGMLRLYTSLHTFLLKRK